MAAEEEVLGKAYDSRLMRRLLGYLRPYWLPVGITLVAIVLKAVADVLGPYLTKTAIDKYIAHTSVPAGPVWTTWYGISIPIGWPRWFFDQHLSPDALTGIGQIASL